jgi:hypothetical protein
MNTTIKSRKQPMISILNLKRKFQNRKEKWKKYTESSKTPSPG